MARKYESAIRTGGRRRSGYSEKKRGGGAIAAVAAIVLVFAAGFLIGNSAPLPRLIGSADTTSSASGGQSSSRPAESLASQPAESAAVPSGLNTVDPPSSGSTALKIGAIDSVTAPSYVVIDRLTGEVILEKNSTQRIYPAGTTEIMPSVSKRT